MEFDGFLARRARVVPIGGVALLGIQAECDTRASGVFPGDGERQHLPLAAEGGTIFFTRLVTPTRAGC